MHDLDEWLEQAYAPAFRTACLILRNPADAEEAVQEAFLRAWRFRSAMPPDDGLRPWLYRVLVNTCWSKLRKERPRRLAGAEVGWHAMEALPAREPSPEAVATTGDVARLVGEVLAELPEHLRVTLVLRYWSGLSEREIAIAIRRRPGTVKSRLHEARRRLAADPRLGALVDEAAEGGA
ncbi:MAG: RNA polymerase sigma factor [Actinobacteria bacterium]|nr:RNA polymerase sigma factor [Actinomycetota bacterium]MBW3649109.1 RNA polymerase sigma factor [Actinomycetota bacterium]